METTARWWLACILFALLGVSSRAQDSVAFNQSQSGDENFRLLVNDLAVVIAPAEALLTADLLSDLPKPKNRLVSFLIVLSLYSAPFIWERKVQTAIALNELAVQTTSRLTISVRNILAVIGYLP
ncbi:hypothetical protein AAG570_000416 [Ranatra chinensis]|uniref:Uncharacterized protein n=1 Tax=Ranatra chinensis TaxID=642074 RepID=A0ABD0YX14_9HEMI